MKLIFGLACLCVCSSLALAQNYYEEYQSVGAPQQNHRTAPARLSPANGPVDTKPMPVAILKQINRHNDDGSYTYGFEGADGSFKIETKAQTGEVKGKYGYVDETGKVRVVEYGADKFGFQPSGEGITVPPPTTVDETRHRDVPEYQDEEEQRPQQRPYIARIPNNPPPQQRPVRPPPQRVHQPQYEEQQQQQYQQPQYELRPQQQAPRRQQFIQSPVPQRPLISGASPSDVTYSNNQRPPRPDQDYFNQPRANLGQAPQQPNYEQHQLSRGYEVEQNQEPTAPRSSQHQQLHFAPSQVAAPQRPQPAPQQTQAIVRPQNAYPQGRSSVLDQLAKDYALPANGASALTDISFGFY